jgi:membrane-associated phospholipid phosphatase
VQAVDNAVRAFASDHLAYGGHAGVAYDSAPGQLLSSLAFVALAAAMATGAALIVSVPDERKQRAWRCVCAIFGVHTFLLIPLVEFAIKPAVHRLRPDIVHHHSYSFPSGHTSSATFISGAVLLVLLPRLLDALAATRADGGLQLACPPRAVLVALWIAFSASTALGRILTDSHWFSDTLCGGLLGALLLATALPLIGPESADVPLIEEVDGPRRSTEQTRLR